jgi:sugar lactone lactonase YvrE
MKKKLRNSALVLLGLIVVLVFAVRIRHGGGEYFPDRTGAPSLPETALETVAELDLPPGNIAVSASGRVFFTFHPEGQPSAIKVAELVDGKPVPFPDGVFQKERDGAPFFDTVLAVRIDRQNRLWTLDFARHGAGKPRLLAFDLETRQVVHDHVFPSDVAGLGSMLNDFQVDAAGETIYIADASIFAMDPSIVVYDIQSAKSRRALTDHPSLDAERFVSRVRGRDVVIGGVFAIRPNVDSIALDLQGEWLYYAAVTAQKLYRIRARDLKDPALTPEELRKRVETFAEKTMSDGMTMDLEGNVYFGDMDHDAILAVGPDRQMRTLLKTQRLRWPDGFSFGPDGWLYVTCSSLQDVIFRSAEHVSAHKPYQIYRFKPGAAGVPGH